MMNKSKQNGLGTLMVVSGIAVIIGAFALVVAQSGFAEVKRTQSIIIASEEGGRAKAGLDCAAAMIQKKGLNPADANFIDELKDCKNAVGVTLDVTPEKPWVVTSKYGNASFKLVMATAGGSGAATFKTAGDVTFEGANDWVPAKLEFVETTYPYDFYKCASIIAGGDVTIGGGFQSGLIRAGATTDRCVSGYTTTVTSVKTNDFGKDIQYKVGAENLDFFSETFNKGKNQWQKVKEDFHVKLDSPGSNCGATLNSLMSSGNSDHKDKTTLKVWIEGNCLLDGFSKDGHNKDLKTLIVVKDGVLASNDAIDSPNASFYLFNNGENVDYSSSWFDADGNCKALFSEVCKNKPSNINDDHWKRMPFLFVGSFVTNGFFIVDVKDSYSHIRGSFKPKYDDTFANNDPDSGKPKILKGSFHDF